MYMVHISYLPFYLLTIRGREHSRIFACTGLSQPALTFCRGGGGDGAAVTAASGTRIAAKLATPRRPSHAIRVDARISLAVGFETTGGPRNSQVPRGSQEAARGTALRCTRCLPRRSHVSGICVASLPRVPVPSLVSREAKNVPLALENIPIFRMGMRISIAATTIVVIVVVLDVLALELSHPPAISFRSQLRQKDKRVRRRERIARLTRFI